jgi:hypothetical protein
MGLAFGYACSRQRAHKSARRATHDCPCRRTSGSRYKPARGHNWSNTWNCQEAEPSQKTADTAHCGSDASALPGILDSICGTILAVSVVNVI